MSCGADGADDGAVGADDGGGGLQIEVAQDVHGEAVAAAGGDDDFDAGGLGEWRAARLRGLTLPEELSRVPSRSMAMRRGGMCLLE